MAAEPYRQVPKKVQMEQTGRVHRPKNSSRLAPVTRGRETWDLTVYAGIRLWEGAELWVNPEIDQGFGLSSTLGIAGFPSGEAYKVGFSVPYARLPRMF